MQVSSSPKLEKPTTNSGLSSGTKGKCGKIDLNSKTDCWYSMTSSREIFVLDWGFSAATRQQYKILCSIYMYNVRI